ncbi:tryptophan synthase beta subunit-like PLP-dependent enzyme [Penicillium argentinense]|uniref:Tryptophan synthase beta subunit-like PLP-dependent enzyme n=1 Tax=Penicillium argentinense TaxID=1131581 RepID=A0A9W9EP89_9EURO|nr:tryptophan synthase beta subunit-like PLP-dependent enzyme [Penicillium argentinense]KAJ5085478.1 tryptophan synthase beta subunit-like PLP-dependent enzyme [Penicillium argentinense]
MGRELVEQIPEDIDVVCGAICGAGMTMRMSKILKESHRQCKVIALEPASLPMLTNGHGGSHYLEGIGIGFLPIVLDKTLYDDALAIDEAEAQEGNLAGTSTGLNVTAAIKLAEQLGPGKFLASVACDTGLKYVRGYLFTK